MSPADYESPRGLWHLPRAAMAFPRHVFALAALAVLPMAFGMTRLELRADGRALLPHRHPVAERDAEIRRTFGIRDQIVVYIQSADSTDIYNARTLQLVVDLTQDLQNLPGVGPYQVLSLATETAGRVWPGTLRFRSFLEPLPESAADMQRVRADVAAIQLFTGTLVSSDAQATAIIVGVPNGVDRHAFVASVREIADRWADGAAQIRVIGAPVAETSLGLRILHDLGVPLREPGSAPRPGSAATTRAADDGSDKRFRSRAQPALGLLLLVIIFLGATVYLFFRSFTAVGLVLGEVVACQAFVLGLMGWTGIPMHITTTVTPVILAAVGIVDELHVLHRYRSLLGTSGLPVRSCLQATFVQLQRPMAATSLTTALGFLAFALSPSVPVRMFGVLTTIGVLFCFLWTLSVTPALLAVLPPASVLRRRAGNSLTPRLLQFAVRLALARPGWVFGAALIVILGMTPGLNRLHVQDSWTAGFSPNDALRKDTEAFDRTFSGAHVLAVAIRESGPVAADEAAPFARPETNYAVCELSAFIRKQRDLGVGAVLGPCEFLETTNYVYLGRREEARRIPKESRHVRSLWHEFEKLRGVERRRQVVTDDFQQAVIEVYVRDANVVTTRDLQARIRAYEGDHLLSDGLEVRFGGDAALSEALVEAITQTQLRSMLGALAGVCLVAAALLRSMRSGLLCALPCALAVYVNFGVMGYASVPLGVATSMFAAIALGIGIDYAIHILERQRQALTTGMTWEESTAAAVTETGPAVLMDAAALCLGFGILRISQVPANAWLGGILALTTATCAVSSLLLVPAALALVPPRWRRAN